MWQYHVETEDYSIVYFVGASVTGRGEYLTFLHVNWQGFIQDLELGEWGGGLGGGASPQGNFDFIYLLNCF